MIAAIVTKDLLGFALGVAFVLGVQAALRWYRKG